MMLTTLATLTIIEATARREGIAADTPRPPRPPPLQNLGGHDPPPGLMPMRVILDGLDPQCSQGTMPLVKSS